jgi:hypothetical protein
MLPLTRPLLCLLLAAAAAACVEPNPAFDPERGLDAADCERGQRITEPTAAFERPDQLDVLLVVSDAPGAEPVQERLAAAAPRLLGLLDAQGLDWRLGVTAGDASSPATAGALRASNLRPGCEDAPRILSPADGDRAGDWAACNALLGNQGSHIQQPLQAALAALTTQATRPASEGGNAGFLRPRARLLIVFVSDRDDCSGQQGVVDASARRAATECARQSDDLTPLADVAQQLLALKNAPSSISVAVLGGPDNGRATGPEDSLEPACESSGGPTVYPTPRLISLSDLLAPQAEFEPACSPSFGVSIAHVARLAQAPPIDICPQADVTDPRVSASLVMGDDTTALPEGDAGVTWLGPTDACPNGLIRVAPDAIEGDDASLELRYCTR